ncbi:MAG: FKBP-type peptidyl-prolyl cis-trans isomerase [Cyanobacteria bacterium]|nr:FKBP-type peptidyl-prolyl cis-trans isomerase [Cyanobacteriota bacterium]
MRKTFAFCCAILFAASFSVNEVAAKNKLVDPKDAVAKPAPEGLGPGATTTPSGLQYKDIKIGTGASPKRGQAVKIHYTGWLYPSGAKFDSSVDRGVPFNFCVGIGGVIPGWDEGVATMKQGGKRLLLIPPKLGYGDRGAGSKVPPNATLKFEVELIKLLPTK